MFGRLARTVIGGLPLYDLRWEHSVDSSAIWLRTIPIPEKFAAKDAKVLLENYIDRIAGSGLTLATYDGGAVAESAR